MKNLGIARNIRLKFVEYKEDGESNNDALSRLMDVANVHEYEFDEKPTTFRVTEENLERLKSFRAYHTEPYSSVLLRLLESV